MGVAVSQNSQHNKMCEHWESYMGQVLYHHASSLSILHDDVIKWKHFPCYCPFVRGIHRSPVNFQCRRALVFSLIFAWINGWINNREAGYFRRHRAHYDVIVMFTWGRTNDSESSWWSRGMETLFAVLALGESNPPVTNDESLTIISLLAWSNCWINSLSAGDVRLCEA